MASETDVTSSYHDELASMMSEEDVYIEENSLITELRKESSMSQTGADVPNLHRGSRRSSIFDVPNVGGMRRRSHGSSITAFSTEQGEHEGGGGKHHPMSSAASLDKGKGGDCELSEKEETVISVTSSSHTAASDPGQVVQVKLENTYALSPSRKFRADPVQRIIQEVLDEQLADKKYDSVTCALASKQLSQEIKTRVKRLNFDRYKIVCVVTIGEKKDQGAYFGSRCVWNTEFDSSASATFENNSLFGVACVYGLYFE